jgi:hypothetical protein
MTLETLLLLQGFLRSSQLNVGDPDFMTTAPKVLRALSELDAAIAELREPAQASPEED